MANTLYIFKTLKQSLITADTVKYIFKYKYLENKQDRQINNIIELANDISNYFNLPIIPTVQVMDSEFPETGTFCLPWEYVTFEDAHILVRHPNHYHNPYYLPTRLNFKKAKTSYNSIKLYFANTVPLIKVNSRNGIIKSLNNTLIIDIDDYIQKVALKTNRSNIKVEIKRRKKDIDSNGLNTYCLNEARELPEVKKSYYLDELCKMQLKHYKVYNFMELRSTSTAFEREDAFCFIIKEKNNKVILAVENTMESRSTIIFFIHRNLLQKALQVINMFFSSNTLNKRQSLQWGDVDFKDSSIIKYERIIHTTPYEWNSAIRSMIYTL